jgi:endoglucanase
MARRSLVLILLAGCGAAAQPPSNDAASPGIAIKLDQVGYLPGEAKLAMVTASGAAGEFQVRRAGPGPVVQRGRLGPPLTDADSGDTVRLADFSALSETGEFVIEVDGVGAGPAFRVAPDVFSRAFYLAARSYYGQRCGTAVDLGPAFPGYAHAACHVEGTSNPDAQFHASSGHTGARAATRGWHDAGDYGKYVVNSGITTGQLLWTYERYANRVAGVRLDIPESGDGTPDLLDEARWNLEWMLSMQDEDGGVWHKLTSARFGGFVMPERDDGGVRYVVGTGAEPYKSTCATADLAAVAAIAGRVYRPFDMPFAQRSLDAARRAFSWVGRHPDVAFRNCCGVVTGEYGDDRCDDEALWAAAELFRTTGEAVYGEYFLRGYAGGVPTVSGSAYPQDWRNVKNMALWAYAFAGAGVDAGAREVIRADTLAAADAIVARSQANGYRVSLRPEHYVWGSNGGVANFGVLLLVADAFSADRRYAQAALDNLHYLLGRNTHGASFVTRLGTRPIRNPHHRPSGGDANTEPWPGLLAGGPNRYDRDGSGLDALAATPPARRYVDQQASYASNENAINWNAPLVFLLASTLPAERHLGGIARADAHSVRDGPRTPP